MNTRASQGIDCMAPTARFAQRKVFAYDGVGYVRSDVGAPAPAVTNEALDAVARIRARHKRAPIGLYLATGAGLGFVIAAVLMALGAL